MYRVLAIDPGDRWVGLASWTAGAHAARECWQVPAKEALNLVDSTLAAMEDRVQQTLVIEQFVLYPDKAKDQAGSPMMTSQMIGALKWIARVHGVKVVEQGASIKKPTAAQLKARGIERMGLEVKRETGMDHASDAELHLMHYILKEELWKQ